MIARAVGCALIAASLGACAWFDAGGPDRSCKADRDCFSAQGERCNLITRQCEVSVDAAVAIDAAAAIDAPDLDATIAGAAP